MNRNNWGYGSKLGCFFFSSLPWDPEESMGEEEVHVYALTRACLHGFLEGGVSVPYCRGSFFLTAFFYHICLDDG